MKLKLFLLLFLQSSMGLYAQSPGGVSGSEVWMKTVPQTKDLQGRYLWKDFAGDSAKLRLYDSRGPLYGSEYTLARNQIRTYNFNPAMDLSEANASKQLLIKRSNLSQATIFSVWGPDNTDFDQDMFLYALNGRAGQSHIFTKDKIIHSNESGKDIFDYGNGQGSDLMYQKSDIEPDVNKFRERALRITAYQRALTPNNSIWGEKNSAVLSIGEIFHPTYSLNTSTFNTSKLNNRAFYGYTPEFIVYSRVLKPLERRKVESYLAFKYGITLQYSYIGSKDQLMWDISENNLFNTRITGYGRDDQSNVYQTWATTSHEEAPYFSDAPTDLYDSFDGDNSYNKPNRYRLLAMCYQQKDSIKDGQYVIYGDNNLPIKAKPLETIAGLNVMERKWLLKTNISASKPSTNPDVLKWSLSGVDYTQTSSGVTVKKDPNYTQARAITATPLLGSKGSIAGTLTGATGSLNITFQVGSYNYGYHIASNGYIYKYYNGELERPQFGLAKIGTRIEVVKDGDVVYILEDGKNYGHYINISDADKNGKAYGSFLISSGASLTDFTAKGFTEENAGDVVELSYIDQRASEFKNYNNGNSFLLVDRSGAGDFIPDNVDYYPMSGIDANRSKILFNNVIWDTDGNGKDVFTFGYLPSGIFGEITLKEPECENNVQKENGSVTIAIKSGLPGYSYALTDIATNNLRSGKFYTQTCTIDGLSSGTYDLTVQEIGGYNLKKESGATTVAAQAITSNYFNSTSNAYLEWTVAGADIKATAGFMMSSSLVSSLDAISFSYGIHTNALNLYSVENNTKASTPFATVQPGDRIKIERIGSTVYLSVNGQTLFSKVMTTAAYNYGVVNIENNGGELLNMKWNKIATGTNWKQTQGLLVFNSSESKITQRVIINANCDKKSNPISEISSDDDRLEVATTGTLSLTARITLDAPERVSFLVYNLSGTLIRKIEMSDSLAVQEAQIDFPMQGVYILKAITQSKEYTKKVFVQ